MMTPLSGTSTYQTNWAEIQAQSVIRSCRPDKLAQGVHGFPIAGRGIDLQLLLYDGIRQLGATITVGAVKVDLAIRQTILIRPAIHLR